MCAPSTINHGLFLLSRFELPPINPLSTLQSAIFPCCSVFEWSMRNVTVLSCHLVAVPRVCFKQPLQCAACLAALVIWCGSFCFLRFVLPSPRAASCPVLDSQNWITLDIIQDNKYTKSLKSWQSFTLLLNSSRHNYIFLLKYFVIFILKPQYPKATTSSFPKHWLGTY